jgi:hypothetical protein
MAFSPAELEEIADGALEFYYKPPANRRGSPRLRKPPISLYRAILAVVFAFVLSVTFFSVIKSHGATTTIPAPSPEVSLCPETSIEAMAAAMQSWQQAGAGVYRLLEPSETAAFLAAYNGEPPESDYQATYIALFVATRDVQLPNGPAVAGGGAFLALYDENRCATVGGAVSPALFQRVLQKAFGTPA